MHLYIHNLNKNHNNAFLDKSSTNSLFATTKQSNHYTLETFSLILSMIKLSRDKVSEIKR